VTSTAKNGVCTAALVCGIVGLVTGVPAIVAILLGTRGREAVYNGRATKGGAATAGLVLGLVGVVLWIVGGTALLLWR
jgi:hypothetical protein